MVSERIVQLKSDNSEIKISAIESFFNSELDAETIDLLCSRVADQDNGVRNALLILFSNNENPLIPARIIPFVQSKDLSTRNFAGELLLRIGSPAVDAMIEFLDKGSHDDIKFIVDLLGLIGDKISVNKILKILYEAADDNIILACIEALGNICESPLNRRSPESSGEGCKDFADSIIEALINCYSKNELFKPTVIESLGKTGNILSSSSAERVLEFVHSKYGTEDELTQLSITECLGKIGNEYSFRLLLQRLDEAKGLLTWETVRSVSELKEKLGVRALSGEKINGVILNTLVEGECRHKLAALKILPSIETKEVMIQCLKLLNGCTEMDDFLKSRFFEKPELFYEASAELLTQGGIEKKTVMLLLAEFWSNSEEEMLKFKAWPGRMMMINSLVSCIESPDEELRITAVDLLFTIDNINAVYFMEEFIEDPSIWNRLRVIDMLDKISHPRACKILRRFVSDKEEMVSTKAKNIMEKRNSAMPAGDIRN